MPELSNIGQESATGSNKVKKAASSDPKRAARHGLGYVMAVLTHTLGDA